MGTEVLHPQDCLVHRITVFPRRRTLYNHQHHTAAHPSSKPIRNKPSLPRSDLKKKQSEPTASRKSSSDDFRSSRNHQQQPVIGQVKILKRGEPLELKPKADDSDPPPGTESLGPEPSTVARQIRIKEPSCWSSKKPAGLTVPQQVKVLYAGSGFVVSPEPESLPLPSFSKQQVSVTVDASATRDLRRLLRLD